MTRSETSKMIASAMDDRHRTTIMLDDELFEDDSTKCLKYSGAANTAREMSTNATPTSWLVKLMKGLRSSYRQKSERIS